MTVGDAVVIHGEGPVGLMGADGCLRQNLTAPFARLVPPRRQ
jgi:hypothetical protein